MSVDKLIAFENVQVIRDYVWINAGAHGFTSLSFFKNLRTIKGQNLATEYVSLVSRLFDYFTVHFANAVVAAF